MCAWCTLGERSTNRQAHGGLFRDYLRGQYRESKGETIVVTTPTIAASPVASHGMRSGHWVRMKTNAPVSMPPTEPTLATCRLVTRLWNRVFLSLSFRLTIFFFPFKYFLCARQPRHVAFKNLIRLPMTTTFP